MHGFLHWPQHDASGLLALCATGIAVLLALIIWVKIEPFIALLVSVLLIALAAALPVQKVVGTEQKSSRPLLESGFGSTLGHIAIIVGLGVSAYVISYGLRIAQGPATVAIVTAGGIVAPLVAHSGYTQPQLALIAVAIGAGPIVASHVNDGGFWIISRYFGIPVKETLKTWTVLETILSVVGFGMAALLTAIVA